MSIVSAVEDVHSVQFKWQSDNTYLTGNVNELPLVVMGNMDKSPATRSIDLLVRALLHDQDFSDDTSYAFNFVRAFLNLHSGWGNAQQMIWYLQYTVYPANVPENPHVANMITCIYELTSSKQ